MKILFKKAKFGGITGRLISIWTRGQYCHTEFIFDDDSDVLFSSSPSDDGVRFIDFGANKWNQYDIVDLPPVDPQTISEIKVWTTTQLGKSYDWLGVFCFILPFFYDDSNDWFCSEICAEIMIKAGLLPELITSKIDPNALAKLVNEKFKNMSHNPGD